MKILIATTQVPFVRGGAEIHAEELRDALRVRRHDADIIAIPFSWFPPERILDQMLACRLLDVTAAGGVAIDLLIGLKFPAYLLPHPRKVLWLLHQHRQAYDLWDHPHFGYLNRCPDGVKVRQAIHRADRQFIPECRGLFTNSVNVARRLLQYCQLASTPLYHPPRNAAGFTCAAAEDYLFFPSRLEAVKRQALVVQALACTCLPVRVRFAGSAPQEAYGQELRDLAHTCKVTVRVEWLGQVSEDEKRRLYARCLAVVYPPHDEDYGYVTLEAMLASKPVLTCTDAGGPLEFVRDGVTGLIAEPTPQGLAAAMDAFWEDRGQASRWGRAGREVYDSLDISWSAVTERLLACA